MCIRDSTKIGMAMRAVAKDFETSQLTVSYTHLDVYKRQFRDRSMTMP